MTLDTQPYSLARSTEPSRIGWRDQIRDSFRRPQDLLRFLDLAAEDSAIATAGTFPMLVPKAFARRMRQGDLNDPLLRQVLPAHGESRTEPGYSSDPVGDLNSRQAPGILHKYTGRVLLVTTGACAVHCRYCFRQQFPYPEERALGRGSEEALAYLAGRSDVEEIILSGGDPLMLSTRRLAALTDRLSGIPGLKRLRLHTRLPIVLPDRVTPALLGWMESLPWTVVIVVHANHAREFDGEVDAALARLGTSGALLLNQAVLLAGINDSTTALKALMERGLQARVLPYYLHLLDRVAGAHRFDVELARARALVEELRRQLPGYLVPRLVCEQAGMPYKTPLV
ncbi:MAG: EF-P beta-lysylation protein EpmB [Wenzhouxiangella sp.]|nr:MAG: EF-P beta-lysylation protein EpmB [Wenzhouxiangella sp.]